jgi:ABC-2 type transport system permease protein
MSDAGVIHDIGYQRYTGRRLGHGHRVGSLYTASLRTAFGIGRGAKAKVFPWFTVAVVAVVATVLVAVRSQTGTAPLSYVRFPDALNALVILFCAAAAPELVSRDLRNRVLSLYFSRPISRTDYPLAKLAALVSAVFLVLGGGQLMLFLGAAFSAKNVGAIWDELGDLLPGLAHSAISALLVGALSLLIASLSGRRAVAAGMIVAAFLITAPVMGVLAELGGTVGQLAGIVSPTTLLIGTAQWLFPDPDGPDIGSYGPVYGAVAAGLITACVLLLLARYRKAAQ